MHKQNKKSSKLIGELSHTSYRDTDGVYKHTTTDEPLDPQPFTREWLDEIKKRGRRRDKIAQNICPDCGEELIKIPAYYGEFAEVAVSCTVCEFHTRLLVKVEPADSSG